MTQGTVYAMAVVPTDGGDGWPVGVAITSIVGKALSLEDVSAFVLHVHRTMKDGKAPLEIHWPLPPDGKHWEMIDNIQVPSVKLKWWEGLTPPFTAYSIPYMENRCVCFGTEFATTVKEFRKFTYPMSVSKISADSLRFRVSEYNSATGKPELWVLAYMTQEKP